jgi:hypothetical protein
MSYVSKGSSLMFYIFTLILPLLLAITLLISNDISILQALLIFLGPICILFISALIISSIRWTLSKINEVSGTDVTFWGLIIFIIGIVLIIKNY